MTTRRLRGITLLLGMLLALPLLGGEAKRGWTKLELVPAEGRTTSFDEVLRGSGAELVSDYGTFAVVSVPEAAVGGLTRAAAARGVAVRHRDDYDVLRLPNGRVDVRDGLRDVSAADLKRSYANGKAGLFVLQLAGPPRREWVDELHAMGWTLARYVPNNGYIAVGVPSLQQPTRKLGYVQWLDVYHPHQKNSFLLRDGQSRELVFDLPSGPALEETIAAIEAAADGPARVDRGPVDTLVYASMPHGRAEAILHHQLVIGVSAQGGGRMSDERQAMSLTSNLDATRSQPTSPTQYWNWVLSRCPNCSSMPSSAWRVGIADTGLDDGNKFGGHQDLAGRKYFGTVFEANDPNTQCAGNCDWAGHGTMVAGVAVGNSGNGYGYGFRDRLVGNDDDPSNLGWYLGTGIAPGAGVFSTKISKDSFPDVMDPTSVAAWIRDAAIGLTPIQNHSFELLGNPDPSGRYTALARAYDLAVRDANGGDAGRPGMFVTVAAGNVIPPGQQNPSGAYHVSANAMAKNVVTVSATENARTVDGCNPGDGFRNIMVFSRMATRIDGYIKPDVVAPGSPIVSTHTTMRSQGTGFAYCNRWIRGYYDEEEDDLNKNEYGIMSGTSFAAPAAAGAGLVVKRYLASSPHDTSPALTKAMLIAGAESIRGGIDRTNHPEFPGTDISPVPSEQQGFGRLSFEDILTGWTPPLHWDQNTAARLFTSTGQAMIGRVRVTDSSKPVKVVLVWSDAAGTPNETDPAPPSPLVNDLDLQVRPAGGSVVYLGNRMTATEVSTAYPISAPGVADAINNVEYARFNGTAQQEFDLTINAARIAQDVLGDAGAEQDFALVITNATLVSELQFQTALPPSTPANLLATASGATVTISWSAAQNATGYLVERKTSSTAWQQVGTVAGTSTTDMPSTATGVVLYRVTATNAALQSAASNTDVAFTGTFTDGTIQTVPALTPVRAVHIAEIRGALNGLRDIAGLTADPGPNPAPGQAVDDAHWTSLMSNVSATRLAAGMTSGWSFRAPAPGPGVPISRTHLEDLRRAFE